jgi:hypothetical protein
MYVCAGISTFLDFEFREELSALGGIAANSRNLVFVLVGAGNMTQTTAEHQYQELELEICVGRWGWGRGPAVSTWRVRTGCDTVLRDGAHLCHCSCTPVCVVQSLHLRLHPSP